MGPVIQQQSILVNQQEVHEYLSTAPKDIGMYEMLIPKQSKSQEHNDSTKSKHAGRKKGNIHGEGDEDGDELVDGIPDSAAMEAVTHGVDWNWTAAGIDARIPCRPKGIKAAVKLCGWVG